MTSDLVLALVRDPRAAYLHDAAALERAAAYIRTAYPRGPETATHRALRAAENEIAATLRARRHNDRQVAQPAPGASIGARPGGTPVPAPTAPSGPPSGPGLALAQPWAVAGDEP